MNDNTIIPSYLGSSNRGEETVLTKTDNPLLRVGEVKKIIYPDKPESISKQFIEYAVEVVSKDGNSPSTTTFYVGCLLSNVFGGWADRLNYTLREDKKTQETNENVYGVGSKVLILCVNGDTDNAVILSGVPDTGTQPEQKETNQGHNLFFEFNGVQFTINKDGELKLVFRGATNTDGTLKDGAVEEAEGSYVQINKEGDIKVATPEDNQFLLINHKDKKIEILAQTEHNTVVKGEVNLTADNDVNIKSSGVKIGDATDYMLLASTYRQNEIKLHSQLMANLATLTSLINTASASITTAATLNAVPMTGGGLAAVPFGAAGVALGSAGPIFSSMMSAIQAFETQAAAYLSVKNKND